MDRRSPPQAPEAEKTGLAQTDRRVGQSRIATPVSPGLFAEVRWTPRGVRVGTPALVLTMRTLRAALLYLWAQFKKWFLPRRELYPPDERGR